MRNASKRSNLKIRLALQWVKVHRPDVYAAIKLEVDKVLPEQKRGITPKALPGSLRKLK